ncbi:MAG: ribosome biogenesis GTPase Der [Steroidobacteraceae bacterium]
MLPIVALVGRPNVGKSTLFNRLTGTRDAIVADEPGVTRDRQYGFGRLGPVPYVVVDTGGLVEQPAGIELPMRLQTERAVAEADRLVFIADARAGLTPQDYFVARELRRSGKPVVLVVNKAEGFDSDAAAADFFALGLGEPLPISAAHGEGCRELMERVLEGFEPPPPDDLDKPAEGPIRIAIIGRPNVGKSTLVNRLIGEERVIASDQPGTTRDSITVPFSRDGHEFALIDTAGVRRRGRIADEVEKASVAKTLQAIDEAHVVIFVVDAHDSIGEQDASVLGLALQRGRALIIAVNKWDGIPMEQREEIRRLLELKLDFVPYAPVFFISARHGTGVGDVVQATIRAHQAAMRAIATPVLTKALERALVQHQPPLVRGRRIKLRYAHQGGRNPPRIIIHGNQTSSVPDSYTRFLANVFRREFDLYATPVAIEYRTDTNPYARPRPGGLRGGRRETKRGRRRRD